MSVQIPWGVAYSFDVALIDRTTKQFRTNPTLAAGDFRYSKDGGALTNLATTPTVTPSGSLQVKVDLSATEAECTRITIYAVDAAGDQWDDDAWDFRTPLSDKVACGKITSGTPTTTTFISSQLTGASTDHLVGAYVVFLTGICASCGPRKITAFNAGTDTVTCEALPAAPSVGDVFQIAQGV